MRETVLFVLGILLGFIVTITQYDDALGVKNEADDKINKCEQNLPRNQTCVIHMEAREKNND